MDIYIRISQNSNRLLITPDEFLTWAKQDIRGGGRRERANALTNAKRAIHGRIDQILLAVRVRYANDWPDRPKTSDKLNVLKKLNIPTTDIVDVLTRRRNDLEHFYLLPSTGQVRSDVQVTELWLKQSQTYLTATIVLAKLPVTSFSVSSSAKTKKHTISATFASPEPITFFWDAKRKIITMFANGSTKEQNYNLLNWKDLVRYQKPYLFRGSPFTVPSFPVATKIYKAYEKWVSGKRGCSFKTTTGFSK